jgi:hypothetical protein
LGCGIDHLHLHVVPLPFSLKNAASKMFPGITWKSISNWSDTSSLFESQISYGLLQEPNNKMFWCKPPHSVRQFFRRVIASQMGIADQFDYAQSPHLSNVLLTLNNLPQPSP